MTQQERFELYKTAGVLQDGHFILTSGKHALQSVDIARLFENTEFTRQVCQILSEPFVDKGITMVIGPALGGIIIAYQMASLLGARCIYAERKNGIMKLLRGFKISPEDRVLVAEDIIKTGISVADVIRIARDAGAEVVGVCAAIDRSEGRADFGLPLYSFLSHNAISYEPECCPVCSSEKNV